MAETPLTRQYNRIKRQYPDTIVFFRLGDFYETFNEDAAIVSSVCDVVLTGRSNGKDERMPMAGVPYHSAEQYIAKLIAAGYKVAVAEQMEQPRADEETKARRTRLAKKESSITANWAQDAPTESARGDLVDRQVVRVVTPGTLVEPSMLDARRNNYLASVIVDGERAGIAYVDITTGEFAATEIKGGADVQSLVQQELDRLQPVELLVPQAVGEGSLSVYKSWAAEEVAVLEGQRPEKQSNGRNGHHVERAEGRFKVAGHITPTDSRTWTQDNARRALEKQFQVGHLEAFGVARSPLATRAAGAIIAYLKEMHGSALQQLTRLSAYSTETHMALDPQTRRNLELIQGPAGGRQYSLLWVLDGTMTAMGSRLLSRWLSQPLVDLKRLSARQEAVQVLYNTEWLRAELRVLLKGMPDIERLVTRVQQGIASPRDLAAIRTVLERVPELRDALERAEGAPSVFHTLLTRLHPCQDVAESIGKAIADEPPAVLGTGAAIRPGFSPELDQLREASTNAKGWLTGLEESEKARTNIPSLKLGYNKIFGYYLEVTSAHKDKVPENYIRRQTLVGAERYITPELKEAESLILNAQEKLVELERQLFGQVLAEVAGCADRLSAVGNSLAHFDVFAALAEVAVTNRYVRPELNEGAAIHIAQGRHPVVEKTLRDEIFVPNDADLDSKDAQIMLLTGPNMAGKSVFMKQVAQIVLMAQIGAFVPADRAEIGLVDRIFTRVGAQDDIATGQSTFMVEMIETAVILNHATSRSLIVLDEIGRGTSTYDGLAIARAVVEYIHNNPRLGAKTLFATHYHELTELERTLPRVRNYSVLVSEEGEQLVFLRQIVPGGADRSYGIHVARLAGVPKSIVKRAEDILRDLEATGGKERRRQAMQNAAGGEKHDNQPSLFNAATPAASEPDPLVAEIRALRVDDMTPIEALGKLYELKKRASDAIVQGT